MKNVLLLLLIVCSNTIVNGQANELIVTDNIHLPKDSVIRKQLLSDLNGFLDQKDSSNRENTFVLKDNLLETSVLLDEMKEVEKNSKSSDDKFYKSHLNNLIRLNDSTYKIQLAYMGVKENQPAIRAIFTLIALKRGNQFYFHSPLIENTVSWKNKKFASSRVYFKNKLNEAKAKDYFGLITEFDKRLNAPNSLTEFYCCDNYDEVLRIIGVDYKSDYNGRTFGTLVANENNSHLVVNGNLTSEFSNFDPHDLWHSRLHNVIPVSIINKPVDEGTAYLYGGSWGQSWKEILEKFKNYANANLKADWISLYNKSENFDSSSKYPLNVDMAINALLVQKIEKEKGFPAVKELLSCGKQEKGNENYFAALEKITGISRKDFNDEINKLVLK